MPLVTLMLPLNSSDVPELRFLRDFTLAVSDPWGTPLIPQNSSSGSFQGVHAAVRALPSGLRHAVHGDFAIVLVPDTVTVGFRLCLSSQLPLGLHLHISSALPRSLTCTRCLYVNEVHRGSLCSRGASQSPVGVLVLGASFLLIEKRVSLP